MTAPAVPFDKPRRYTITVVHAMGRHTIKATHVMYVQDLPRKVLSWLGYAPEGARILQGVCRSCDPVRWGAWRTDNLPSGRDPTQATPELTGVVGLRADVSY